MFLELSNMQWASLETSLSKDINIVDGNTYWITCPNSFLIFRSPCPPSSTTEHFSKSVIEVPNSTCIFSHVNRQKLFSGHHYSLFKQFCLFHNPQLIIYKMLTLYIKNLEEILLEKLASENLYTCPPWSTVNTECLTLTVCGSGEESNQQGCQMVFCMPNP